MAAESRDVLAGLYRVRLRLIRLAAQPGDDRDAVVAKDHEAVVQVAHQSRKLELQDVLENLEGLGGVRFTELCAHDGLPKKSRAGMVCLPVVYRTRRHSSARERAA